MKFTSVLLLAVISTSLLAALALEYPRPAPAFSAEITLQVSDHQHEEMYHGTMYHNSVARVQLIDVPADSFVRLERWDTVRKLSGHFGVASPFSGLRSIFCLRNISDPIHDGFI